MTLFAVYAIFFQIFNTKGWVHWENRLLKTKRKLSVLTRPPLWHRFDDFSNSLKCSETKIMPTPVRLTTSKLICSIETYCLLEKYYIVHLSYMFCKWITAFKRNNLQGSIRQTPKVNKVLLLFLKLKPECITHTNYHRLITGVSRGICKERLDCITIEIEICYV